MTTITALPTPPSRANSATFATQADALLSALPDFVTEVNLVGTEVTAASGYATTATTQAGIATTQAGIATTQAGIATTQAGDAATQVGIATTQAGIATTQANTATTQAGIATTKASEANASAIAAAASVASIAGGPVASINGMTGVVTLNSVNALNSATTVVDVSAATAPTTGQVLTATSGTNATWQTPAAGGDMVLADVQSVTGLKTFDPSKLAMKGSSTGVSTFATANASANNYTITFPASTGTVLITGGALGTPSSGTLTNCTADGTNAVGFKTVPQNSKSAAYTLVLGDSGYHILHPSADTTARIFTIPANASVAYPIGTAITFVNQDSAGTLTIAITTDTMRLAGAGTTGSRTLAANGTATALKLTATEWIISGTNLV